MTKRDLSVCGGGKSAPSLCPNRIDLSFIIPVYNGERFLERCVRSILQQETSATYEVICINDGSSDGSLEILKALQKEFPTKLIVETQPNQGISVTRNRGIELARGEYIGFMDNDDFVEDGYVEQLWQCRLSTDADMIQTGYNIVDAEGNKQSSATHKDCVVEDQSDISDLAWGYVWSGLHRKSQFQSFRFPVGYWYEDMITKMLLTRICKRYAFVGACLYNKTEHTTNASKTLWNDRNYKCIDQYFLAFQLAEYGTQELNLPIDASLYKQLLLEMDFLWSRTRHIGIRYREALFVLSAERMRHYSNQLTTPLEYATNHARAVDADFQHNTYWKWELDGWLARFERNL